MVAVELNDRRRHAIDWSAPWFGAVAAVARAIPVEGDLRTSLDASAARRGIANALGAPIRFGAGHAAGRVPYEAHIASTGEVPTRDNLHDFFNALVWLTYPRTKARLNALQAHGIATAGAGARRGALRDAATLIDENAVLLLTRRADAVDALIRHDWHALFVERRADWGTDIHAVAFGHALMEKLTAPYKGITAHALVVPVDADASTDAVDTAVATALDIGLTPQRLLPLPVLGIPGWANNDDPTFYRDAAVFRPARTRRLAGLPSRGG